MQPTPTATGISPDWRNPVLEVLGYGRAYFACGMNMNNCSYPLRGGIYFSSP